MPGVLGLFCHSWTILCIIQLKYLMKRMEKIKFKTNYDLKHFFIFDTIKKTQGPRRSPGLGSLVQQKKLGKKE
ncbi:hypothetical protein BpHYR1_049107 [Brachionus plicatilis]|uniref:Uncharacterized protein n=1 Tax=Brachionus plicatilis TaxID=10195 RepID=A0A3M7QY58_BRAPC|nr:hypothetical protein BpHYR1_049107 [Brachionus plicatilis]